MSEKLHKGLYIVLSVLIAIVFWLFVDNEQGNTIQKFYSDVPIDFVGELDTLPSRGLMLEEREEDSIDLWLSGPRTVISGLDAKDIRVQVDLTNVTAVGSRPLGYRILFPSYVNQNDITVDKASLSSVNVKISELYTKDIPLKLSVTGEVAEGYIFMAEKLVASPAVITLGGKEDVVREVASARITLDIQDAKETIHQEFSYELLNASGEVVSGDHIQVSDKQVDVFAPVYMQKELDLTVKLKESPGSYIKDVDFHVFPETIQVAGEAASLENKVDIVLDEVALSSLLGDTDMELEIDLPANTVNLSGFTTATLSVHFVGLETQVFSVTDISAIGLQDGLRFKAVTSALDVILRGPSDELQNLKPEDVRIVVDLAQYTSPGTYSVPAMVLVDGSDEVGAVGSCSVACKIIS